MQVMDGQSAAGRKLTPKETMIVFLLGAGRTTSEIAALGTRSVLGGAPADGA